MFFSRFFQKRTLRKHAYTGGTAIVPLSNIKTATVLIDAEESSADECKSAVQSYLRSKGISVSFLFTDFRKIDESDRLITSIKGTILKKDLNWYGCPSAEKISMLKNECTDLFISLTSSSDYTFTFIANCISARFKVGRTQLATFDMILNGSEKMSQTDVFKSIVNLLEKVK